MPNKTSPSKFCRRIVLLCVLLFGTTILIGPTCGSSNGDGFPNSHNNNPNRSPYLYQSEVQSFDSFPSLSNLNKMHDNSYDNHDDDDDDGNDDDEHDGPSTPIVASSLLYNDGDLFVSSQTMMCSNAYNRGGGQEEQGEGGGVGDFFTRNKKENIDNLFAGMDRFFNHLFDEDEEESDDDDDDDANDGSSSMLSNKSLLRSKIARSRKKSLCYANGGSRSKPDKLPQEQHQHTAIYTNYKPRSKSNLLLVHNAQEDESNNRRYYSFLLPQQQQQQQIRKRKSQFAFLSRK